jgi:hypothetical protein
LLKISRAKTRFKLAALQPLKVFEFYADHQTNIRCISWAGMVKCRHRPMRIQKTQTNRIVAL